MMTLVLRSFFFLLLNFFLMAVCAAKIKDQTETIVYKGPIYNIFFHPTIAYPKIAFDHKNTRLEYIDSWFITTREFNKILPELYAKGFVLFSPKDLFTEKEDNKGKLIITRKKILLPIGKKPLVLSLDDYNFYTSMKLHGTIHRFWVDPQNRLATVTHQNAQQAIIRYDQEIPQLLEKFIAIHPDFSFNHARGIFALTGYNGIFGYNIQNRSGSFYLSQLQEAKKVVRKLKEMGWEFGSHSYFHLGSSQQSKRDFEISEKRWIKEVGQLVNPSSYYIFPFGDPWDEHPERMNFLKSLGYKYFFGVSTAPRLQIKSGIVLMERFPIDGLALRNRYSHIKTFITPSNVFDIERPANINHRKS